MSCSTASSTRRRRSSMWKRFLRASRSRSSRVQARFRTCRPTISRTAVVQGCPNRNLDHPRRRQLPALSNRRYRRTLPTYPRGNDAGTVKRWRVLEPDDQPDGFVDGHSRRRSSRVRRAHREYGRLGSTSATVCPRRPLACTLRPTYKQSVTRKPHPPLSVRRRSLRSGHEGPIPRIGKLRPSNQSAAARNSW